MALAAFLAAAGHGQVVDREGCFNAGLETEYVHYEEENVMDEKGLLFGLFGSYTRFFNEVIMAQGFASFVFGDLRYEGGIRHADGTVTPNALDTPNKIFNLRFIGGYRFFDVEIKDWPFDATPYAGFGYRYLVDELPGDAGYKREQTYIYLPIGVQTTSALGTDWIMECRVEYDYFVRGRHEVDLQGGLEFSQSSGSGFRASARFVAPAVDLGEWLQDVTFSVEPFFQRWHVDDSNVVGGRFEPENTSTTVGARVGARF